MRNKRWLFIPLLMVLIMGCDLVSGAQTLQNAAGTALPAIQTAASTAIPAIQTAASTAIPAMQTAASTAIPALLTSVPTAQGFLETAAAQLPTSSCAGTPTAGGLGLSMDRSKTLLKKTQQFTLADATVNGQPAVTVTLSAGGVSSFPAIAQGFSAQFIGDICNLSEIMITLPRSDQQDTVDQGVSLINLVLVGTLPLDVQLTFLPWVADNYAGVAVSGQQQTTIKNMQFTLSRNQASMVLDIVPKK